MPNGNEFLNWTVTGSWSQSTLNRGRMATRGAADDALEVSIPLPTWVLQADLQRRNLLPDLLPAAELDPASAQ